MVKIFLVIGVIAALLMFLGDMLLYFTTGEYDTKGVGFEAVTRIMKEIPEWRLIAGGAIGPIAAFLYCVSFYHVVLIAGASGKILAWSIMLLCSVGIIVGGAYHSQCSYLGLIGRLDCKEAMEKIEKNLNLLVGSAYIPQAIGYILLIIGIAMGMMNCTKLLIIFSPAVMFLLGFIWRKTKQPIRIVLYGGWNNLLFVVYYVAALILIK